MDVHSESHIAELEEQLRQAMLTSDVAALDALIAPELLFTNHLGQLVSKQADLEMHRSGILNLKALTPSEQHIQCRGGFSLVSVKMHVCGSYQGTPVDQHIRFTRVWAAASPNSLQIVAGHASVVSP